ncbi:MAG: nuclear transport factor 2 family protein, partial [Planctomycetales bacterium]
HTSSWAGDKDDAAVRTAVDEYAKAWNEGEGKGVAKLWSPGGVFINEQGERSSAVQRQEQVEKKGTPGAPRPQVAVVVDSVRLVGSNVALVEGTDSMTFASPPGVTRGRFSAVFVQRDGKWLIEEVRQLGKRSEDPVDHLHELEWMIGDWIGLSGDLESHSSVQWSENKKFITREFKVFDDDDLKLSGTQVIGWDPKVRKLKSWYFDSTGCIGEGVWVQDGEHWIVNISGVLEDGQIVTATNVYTPVDQDSYLRQSLQMKIGGRAVADREVRVVRNEES